MSLQTTVRDAVVTNDEPSSGRDLIVTGCQSNVPGRHDNQLKLTAQLVDDCRNPVAD